MFGRPKSFNQLKREYENIESEYQKVLKLFAVPSKKLAAELSRMRPKVQRLHDDFSKKIFSNIEAKSQNAGSPTFKPSDNKPLNDENNTLLRWQANVLKWIAKLSSQPMVRRAA